MPTGSRFSGKTLHDLLAAVEKEADVVAVGRARGQRWTPAPSTFHVLRAGDVPTAEADAASLRTFLEATALELSANGAAHPEDIAHPPEELVEVVVEPSSSLVGRTISRLDLREHAGVNVLGVARLGHQVRRRLGRMRFEVGTSCCCRGGRQRRGRLWVASGCSCWRLPS